MKHFLFILFILISFSSNAQHAINGIVVDEKAGPLSFATVALLHPEDSSLAYFGITSNEGTFEIKNIKAGNYLLQSAYIGFHPLYKNMEIPVLTGENIEAIVMKPEAINLTEAEISAEKIPLLIKKDTIEYDAGSYKTKPDAAAEDLLKKLPGVEVDRSGNIKAQGENVKNVLVDGKEFFGSDPKVATKNLPADAIKKVQVYDKKSDETELTGIEDGTRDKTINLVLKDGKKSAWFGDVLGGAGTDAHYQASAKAYRFTKTSQFAILGMLNNINQFGFSFKDYIDFNGGFSNMMNGDGNFRLNVNNDNSFPINFGQPVMGLITSGAGGLNYSYEKKKDNRFNISYLGNGADKKLDENTFSENFTPGNTFTQNQNLNEINKNRAHRFNLGWRNKIDSSQTIITNGTLSLTNGKTNSNSFSESFASDTLLNDLTNTTTNNANKLLATAHGAYLKKFNTNWQLFKIYVDGSNSYDLSKTDYENIAHYFDTGELVNNNQFQHIKNNLNNYSAGISIMRKIVGAIYLQPGVSAGVKMESLKKEEGLLQTSETLIDSLSPDFNTGYNWVRPALSFKFSNQKTQFNFTAQLETGKMISTLKNENTVTHSFLYFTPRLSWDYEYRNSHRIGAYYETSANVPTATQLLPVINNVNPLQLYSGNQNLRPEYQHYARLNWNLFDQFSFTSVFAGINGTYTHDKINWWRVINNDFSQSVTLVNVDDDYKTQLNADFSTPVRKLGINFNLRFSEMWNRGINFVNAEKNINTNIVQEYTISIDNRKKEKWEASVGGTVQLTNSKYSIQKELNNNYSNLNYFAEFSYTPTVHWHFTASADITQYNMQSFGSEINIPLVKAAITRYFLKANRGVLTFEVFDALNKNTGIDRISELNYLQEKKSNIIGRYVMLSFKYRLNKFSDKGGLNIKVNGK